MMEFLVLSENLIRAGLALRQTTTSESIRMKSAEDRLSSELSEPLDRPMARRILVQGQMRSEFVDSRCRQQESDAGGPRRRRRCDQGIPGGSSRSDSPHARSARRPWSSRVIADAHCRKTPVTAWP